MVYSLAIPHVKIILHVLLMIVFVTFGNLRIMFLYQTL